jgi:hypothetical protein
MILPGQMPFDHRASSTTKPRGSVRCHRSHLWRNLDQPIISDKSPIRRS